MDQGGSEPLEGDGGKGRGGGGGGGGARMMDTSRSCGSCGFIYTIYLLQPLYINIIHRALDHIKIDLNTPYKNLGDKAGNEVGGAQLHALSPLSAL